MNWIEAYETIRGYAPRYVAVSVSESIELHHSKPLWRQVARRGRGGDRFLNAEIWIMRDDVAKKVRAWGLICDNPQSY